jgi:hypothetical protein
VGSSTYIEEATREFRRLKSAADRALAQIRPQDLFRSLGPDENSIAIILKHLAGNMRSRWTDFLTTDGEKPDRNRDAEFEREEADSREDLLARWERGWEILFAALAPLTPADMDRTVTIRGEPHTVLQAVNRALCHCAGHVGQIVLLAKHFAGTGWQTLTMPKQKPAGAEPPRH